MYLLVHVNIADPPAAACYPIGRAPIKEAWAPVMLEETFLLGKSRRKSPIQLRGRKLAVLQDVFTGRPREWRGKAVSCEAKMN